MPNRRHYPRRDGKGRGPAEPKRAAPPSKMPMKTAAWPGVPGGTQPRDRSNGVRKIKQSPREEGL